MGRQDNVTRKPVRSGTWSRVTFRIWSSIFRVNVDTISVSDLHKEWSRKNMFRSVLWRKFARDESSKLFKITDYLIFVHSILKLSSQHIITAANSHSFISNSQSFSDVHLRIFVSIHMITLIFKIMWILHVWHFFITLYCDPIDVSRQVCDDVRNG